MKALRIHKELIFLILLGLSVVFMVIYPVL
jgi:hypothetical protein